MATRAPPRSPRPSIISSPSRRRRAPSTTRISTHSTTPISITPWCAISCWCTTRRRSAKRGAASARRSSAGCGGRAATASAKPCSAEAANERSDPRRRRDQPVASREDAAPPGCAEESARDQNRGAGPLDRAHRRRQGQVDRRLRHGVALPRSRHARRHRAIRQGRLGYRRARRPGALPRSRDLPRDGRGLHLGHAGSRPRHRRRARRLGIGKSDDRRPVLSLGIAGRAQHRLALRVFAARRGHGSAQSEAARPACYRHGAQRAGRTHRGRRSRHRDELGQASVSRRGQGASRDRVLMTRALMLQGTGSDVGKSLLVAGLARAFTRRGLSVLPFKPQNMSNNAAVTEEGGEIGRAQALQARACRVTPITDMNPVLLKPQSEGVAQLVVSGHVHSALSARDYRALAPSLLPQVLAAFQRSSARADLVLIEGAGSPAEINLRAGDIANMGFAEAADVPVVLLGDIERGGVIAQLIGTYALLSQSERDRLAGYIVNKFRGDPRLFDGGIAAIGERTGLSCFGVVPYFPDAALLPAEDSMALATRKYPRRLSDRAAIGAADRPIRVAVPVLQRIANFDDLD